MASDAEDLPTWSPRLREVMGILVAVQNDANRDHIRGLVEVLNRVGAFLDHQHVTRLADVMAAARERAKELNNAVPIPTAADERPGEASLSA